MKEKRNARDIVFLICVGLCWYGLFCFVSDGVAGEASSTASGGGAQSAHLQSDGPVPRPHRGAFFVFVFVMDT